METLFSVLNVIGYLLCGLFLMSMLQITTKRNKKPYTGFDQLMLGVGVVIWPLELAIVVIALVVIGLGKLVRIIAK